LEARLTTLICKNKLSKSKKIEIRRNLWLKNDCFAAAAAANDDEKRPKCFLPYKTTSFNISRKNHAIILVLQQEILRKS
jgi:hypothetical protein